MATNPETINNTNQLLFGTLNLPVNPLVQGTSEGADIAGGVFNTGLLAPTIDTSGNIGDSIAGMFSNINAIGQPNAVSTLVRGAASLLGLNAIGLSYSNQQRSNLFTYVIDVEGRAMTVDYLMKPLYDPLKVSKTIKARLSTDSDTALSTDTLNINGDGLTLSQNVANLLGDSNPNSFAVQGVVALASQLGGESNAILNFTSNQIQQQVSGALQSPALAGITQALDGVASPINNIGAGIGLPNLIPTSNDLISALNPAALVQGLGLPSILPSVGLGTFGELFSIGAQLARSGPPTSISGFLELQEQIYTAICNFEWPWIDPTWLRTVYDLIRNFKWEDVKKLLIQIVTNFVKRILDRFNIIKIIIGLLLNWERIVQEILDEIEARFLSCDRYKKSDRSGRNNTI